MDLSPTATIALIGIGITLLTLFAGIVAGFVRLESKNTQHAQDIGELYKHVEDRDIHHPSEDLDRRFLTIKEGMDKIEKGIDKLVSRFDSFLSK